MPPWALLGFRSAGDLRGVRTQSEETARTAGRLCPQSHPPTAQSTKWPEYRGCPNACQGFVVLSNYRQRIRLTRNLLWPCLGLGTETARPAANIKDSHSGANDCLGHGVKQLVWGRLLKSGPVVSPRTPQISLYKPRSPVSWWMLIHRYPPGLLLGADNTTAMS